MNVKQLKEHIEQYPDDMKVLFCQYSDYVTLNAEDIFTQKGVDKGSYVMRHHETMSEDNHAKCTEYLVFPGN